MGGAKVTISAGPKADPPGHYWGAVEFVPSKVVDPTAARICSFRQWPAVRKAVLDETSRWLSPLVDRDEFTVTRLDVSRDFDDVESIPVYAYAALARPMPHANRKEIWADGGPQPQSFYAGTKISGHVKLYDRHALHPDVVPPGRIRLEVQGNKGWLNRYAGISRLSDLTQKAALDFLVNRWEWFGGAVPIVGQDRFLHVAQMLTDDDGEPWSPPKRRGFIGHSWSAARGLADPLHSGLKAEYRKAVARTGITLDEVFTGITLPDTSTRYLDLYTGTEVRTP